MKKIFAFLLALITVSSLIAGCTPNNTDDPQESSSYITTDETTTENIEPTETLATDSGNTEQPVGTGGSIVPDLYLQQFDQRFYGCDSRLTDHFDLDGYGGKTFSEILQQYWDEVNRQGYRNQMSILTFIKDFNVTKDTLLEVSHETAPYNRFTDEEIEMFFSADLAGIRSAFVSKHAILSGDTIYTPFMLEQMTFDEMKAVGITETIISEKMPIWEIPLGHTTFYAHMLEICDQNNIEFVIGEDNWSDYVAENGYLKVEQIIFEPDYKQLLDEIKEFAE